MTPRHEALVVVCTKDRPTELQRCLLALAAGCAPGDSVDVLVVDASADGGSAAVCLEAPQALSVERVEARPGLAAQRNTGLSRAHAGDYRYVVFVDDDVVVQPGFVAGIVKAFAERPWAAGIGAVVTDEPQVSFVVLKRAFWLWSSRPGAVLRSGRNVIGHGPGGPWPREVEWLSTCAVGYRLALLGALRFDDRLQDYSYGEDLDLSWRLSRSQRLSVVPELQVQHLQSSRNRPAQRALSKRRTVLLHAWVVEHRSDGMSLPLFWWSVAGEVLLGLGQALRGQRRGLDTAAGAAGGAWVVLRRGSSRLQT